MAKRRESGDGDTRSQILDIAERLVQNRGFNAFSYADVATELGLTTAALHYHFAGKSELGEALLTRCYAPVSQRRWRQSTPSPAMRPASSPRTPISMGDVLRDQRMCLCGMLAAEYQTLPSRCAAS